MSIPLTKREWKEIRPYNVHVDTWDSYIADRIEATVNAGRWEPDTCHLCGHKDAEDMCEGCGRPVCLLCSTPDMHDPIRICRKCGEGV